jgi:signal transduction histidine kinase
MPDLDEVIEGDIHFDPIPEGLSKLPVKGLPTRVERCKRGESCLHDDVFKALDAQEIVFFPMKYKEQLEAAVLLDNFLSGKEPSKERLDILRDSAMDYATFLKTQVMFRQIEKEDKQKGELLHVLAHRLRTDLSGPYLWIRRAIKDGSGLDEAKLSMIADKLWTSYTAINDILRFSVIESDSLKKNASFAAVDVGDLINSALQEVSIDKSGLVHRENTKGLKVRADSEMLKHALLNLLDNAVLYSKEDSAIEISVQPRYNNTDQIRIEIINEPKVPIGKDEWQLMFNKFFRGENARFAKGTGLGLYVVDHIVLAHGGHVEASPVDNGLVCFAIMIPAADEEG